MLKKLVLLSFTILLSQFALAKPQSKPEQCPNINVVQAVGLTRAEGLVDAPNLYAIFELSHFGLKALWEFVVIPVEAYDEIDAIKKGNDLLKNVSSSPSPEGSSERGWFCLYAGSENTPMVYADTGGSEMSHNTFINKFNG